MKAIAEFTTLNALMGDLTAYPTIADMPAELKAQIRIACNDVIRATNDTSAFASSWIAALDRAVAVMEGDAS